MTFCEACCAWLLWIQQQHLTRRGTGRAVHRNTGNGCEPLLRACKGAAARAHIQEALMRAGRAWGMRACVYVWAAEHALAAAAIATARAGVLRPGPEQGPNA